MYFQYFLFQYITTYLYIEKDAYNLFKNYLKICINPKIISRKIPNILAYTPSFFPEYLPINKPKNVKEKEQRLKMNPDKKISLVIALIPNPVEKLSKLTEIDTKSILNKFSSKYLSSHFNKSTIISTPINSSINPNRKFTFIFKNVIILPPKIEPKRGIKKCIIPTNVHKNKIFFLDISNVPILKDIENVSIDKDTPIIKSEIIIDT